MKQVLFISHTEENECIDQVTAALAQRGAEVIRFDTDIYPEEIQLSSEFKDGAWRYSIQKGQEKHNLDNLEAIYYRRNRTGKSLKGKMDQEFISPTLEESRRTLMGVINSFPGFVLDPVWLIRHTENKQVQLKAAVEAGLSIPKTLFSNSPDEVRNFYKACNGQMIAKMQSSFAINRDGKEHVVFTNVITDEDMQDIDALTSCPMIFQENIAKKLELRCTVVGSQVFSSAVDSQASGKSDEDWRKDGEALASKWTPYQLPAALEQKLLAMMDALGLNYGAADFILTPDEEFVFLEVNPAGEYFWLDKAMLGQNGHPIAEALADVLLGIKERRAIPYRTEPALY